MSSDADSLFRVCIGRMPLIAVLRGVQPAEVGMIGEALVDAGFAVAEVPLNSPQPFASVRVLADRFGDRCLIGAGTVLAIDDVARIADAGGRLVVMPHSEARVIAAAKRHRMICLPGVATPTEAFAALDAGADGLKLFPAEQLAPPVLKAWRAVLPPSTLLFPVGGIEPATMAPYWAAGASGFGTGSGVYRPGSTAASVAAAATAFVAAFRALPPRAQGGTR
jgi:2-dehydro-3-deoxyphosphogalactonate aldolase